MPKKSKLSSLTVVEVTPNPSLPLNRHDIQWSKNVNYFGILPTSLAPMADPNLKPLSNLDKKCKLHHQILFRKKQKKLSNASSNSLLISQSTPNSISTSSSSKNSVKGLIISSNVLETIDTKSDSQILSSPEPPPLPFSIKTRAIPPINLSVDQ